LVTLGSELVDVILKEFSGEIWNILEFSWMMPGTCLGLKDGFTSSSVSSGRRLVLQPVRLLKNSKNLK
jgi:hypothetical protein